MVIEQGAVFEYTRTFSREQILQFAELSGDRGEHHMHPDKKVMAHGLLIASIITKLGGDINYISTEMTVEFRQAVYEDELVTGRVTLEKVVDKRLRKKIVMLCQVFKADGSLALSGGSHGQVLKTEALEARVPAGNVKESAKV